MRRVQGGAEAEGQGEEASYLLWKLNSSRVKSHQTWLGFTKDDSDVNGRGRKELKVNEVLLDQRVYLL